MLPNAFPIHSPCPHAIRDPNPQEPHTILPRSYIKISMEKFALIEDPNPTGRYIYWCPACATHHFIDTKPDPTIKGSPTWLWNGNMVKPTVYPSIRVQSGNAKGPILCHFYITDGRFHYCGDCSHLYRDRIVDMVPINEV